MDAPYHICYQWWQIVIMLTMSTALAILDSTFMRRLAELSKA